MVDLNRAYEEAKSLPDEALSQELSNPTGFLPGYIIMSELEERKAIRDGAGGQAPKGSMKDELLSQMGGVRQYAQGGIVAQLNPGYARMLALRIPAFNSQLMQSKIMDANGGIAPLMPAQAAQPAQAPPSLSSMQLTAPSAPEELREMGGGLSSLLGRIR